MLNLGIVYISLFSFHKVDIQVMFFLYLRITCMHKSQKKRKERISKFSEECMYKVKAVRNLKFTYIIMKWIPQEQSNKVWNIRKFCSAEVLWQIYYPPIFWWWQLLLIKFDIHYSISMNTAPTGFCMGYNYLQGFSLIYNQSYKYLASIHCS